MTNEMIMQIAMEQSAIDSNCEVEDFVRSENVITISKENHNARRYLQFPHICDLTSYGTNIVATIDEKYRDIVAAYDGDKLIGLAGCSADCDTMWQIGVDVLPKYRKRGIASAITSRLAIEIINRGKVPFYCCAWSNIKSARNAIKSGFRPAWVQMTVKSAEMVADMNK